MLHAAEPVAENLLSASIKGIIPIKIAVQIRTISPLRFALSDILTIRRHQEPLGLLMASIRAIVLMVCAKALAHLNIIMAMFTQELGITTSAKARVRAHIKMATDKRDIGRTTPMMAMAF